MAWFKKPSPEELMRENDRSLRKIDRGLDRDRLKLEREEKNLEGEIKKAAKRGDKQLCTVYAKQLVQLRKQKTRFYSASSQIKTVGVQQKLMHSNSKVAGALGSTAKVMGTVNKQMDPQKTASILKQFQMENAKMEMSEEMINETLDDIMTEDGDEEEEDSIVNQVLDEMGIQQLSQMADVPVGKETAKVEDPNADLEALLTQLKAS